MSSELEHRPTRLDPQELGFTPRTPVAWLAPMQLSRTAVRVALAELFGAYLDKRELQNALAAQIHTEGEPDGELWFDFVADLGDGFDATYTMAYLLAQDSLDLDGAARPRGEVLIMGGDEVYPTASGHDYEDRTRGPYKAAMPVAPPDTDRPRLYALPGNHDWYDGLTAFLRIFARGDRAHIGGWSTRQSRSYFAMALPHRWWLFAIDTEFGSYVDDPQLTYLHDAARHLRPGDRVILCAPAPGWVHGQQRPDAYDAIDYVVRTVIEPTGAAVPLMLSGDLHHYARYAQEPDAAGTEPDAAAQEPNAAGTEPEQRHRQQQRQLVHCGGGGAYLYGTHDLPGRLAVPPPASVARRQSATRRYRLAATYPDRGASRRYAAGVFARLPLRNLSFAGLIGLVQTLFMLSVVDAGSRVPVATLRLITIPVVLMALLIIGGADFLAMSPPGTPRSARKWMFGTGHGAVHIGLGILGAQAWQHLPFVHWPWPLPLVAALLLYLPVAALVATETVCLYLLVASFFGVNFNEVFAGQSIVDAKSFLRLHIDAAGHLTVYPVAVPRACRSWTAAPDAPAHRPWFEPTEPIAVRLAEPPVHVA